jgi:hypothetical protein
VRTVAHGFTRGTEWALMYEPVLTGERKLSFAR